MGSKVDDCIDTSQQRGKLRSIRNAAFDQFKTAGEAPKTRAQIVIQNWRVPVVAKRVGSVTANVPRTAGD